VSGTATVEPDPRHPAGHALIRLRDAAGFAGPYEFCIRRDDFDDGVLGPGGWQVADARLRPEARSVDGNDLLLHVGPAVVQRIMSGVYHFALPGAGIETAVVWPDLPLLSEGALNIVAEPARAASRSGPAPRPQIRRRAPEATPDGASDVAPGAAASGVAGKTPPDADATALPPPLPVPRPSRSPWLWLGGLALLLALVAGGGYLAYRHLHPPPPPSPPPPRPVVAPEQPPNPPPPPRPPAAPDLTAMTAIEAMRSGAPPEALLTEAQRRMALGGAKANDGLMLMQAAADRDYAPAHAALGRLYDPNLQHPPEIQPDPREAAKHYRAAIRGGDASVSDARQALNAYLQQQAQRDDLYAPQILKDFWP